MKGIVHCPVEYERALTKRRPAGAMFSTRGENTILAGLDDYSYINRYIDDRGVLEVVEKLRF